MDIDKHVQVGDYSNRYFQCLVKRARIRNSTGAANRGEVQINPEIIMESFESGLVDHTVAICFDHHHGLGKYASSTDSARSVGRDNASDNSVRETRWAENFRRRVNRTI